jgi:hypothetical protein
LKRVGSLPQLFLCCAICLCAQPLLFAQDTTVQAQDATVQTASNEAAALPSAPAVPGYSSSVDTDQPVWPGLDVVQSAAAPAAPQTDQKKPEKLPGDKGDRVHYDKNGNVIQNPSAGPSYGRQPQRIMGWIPNYRAVSVGVKPPPPTFKEKLLIGTQNTFDYSAFIFNAVDSEFPYVTKSYPEFGNGWVGYGVYYWHGFVDKGIGNYMTDTIVPTLTRQDSRYYALGRGHWYVRAIYAYTRVLITPDDAGKNTFNYSEIVGKGAAAGLGDLYYPARYRDWTKTGQRWLVQVAIRDGGFNVFREFWPDIAQHILHLGPKNQ